MLYVWRETTTEDGRNFAKLLRALPDNEDILPYAVSAVSEAFLETNGIAKEEGASYFAVRIKDDENWYAWASEKRNAHTLPRMEFGELNEDNAHEIASAMLKDAGDFRFAALATAKKHLDELQSSPEEQK